MGLVLVALLLPGPPAGADDRQIVGAVEDVRLYPGDIAVRARVDSGAKTSSLDVSEIEVIERDRQDWARFSFTNRVGRTVRLERPIIRGSRLRRAGTEKVERPVVRLRVCLGRHLKDAEVNLTDRTGMTYRFLIGRQVLGGHYLIDPYRSFLAPPDCGEVPAK